MTILISFLIIFAIISSNIAIKIAKEHEQQVAHRNFLIAEVYEKSIALKEIKQLNRKYFFHNIEKEYTYTKYQKTLSAFQRINYEKELIDYLRQNQFFFEDKVKKCIENQKNYENYINEFYYIKNINSTLWDSDFQTNYEEDLLMQEKQSPICSIQITIHNSYSSPQGRQYHHNSHTFSQIQIQEAFNKISKQETFDEDKRKERSKMNDSLRYDILKRDGFRCTICGASANEGAKLHVDHIIPISKGGKTIKSNLRTLCSSCNMGKSDKYDPNGVN